MEIFRQIISGFFVGYILTSSLESLIHQGILHAKGRRRRLWRNWRHLGNYITTSWYSHHVVHHFRTFRSDHINQFETKQQETNLRRHLIEKGYQQIVSNSYGLRVGRWHQQLKYLLPHLPTLLIISYLGGFWFALGAIVPLIFYIWVAEYIHPLVHLPYSKAMATASPLMQQIIKSNYFKRLCRHHYLHHKYINCNFNLMLGGDWLLRCHRSPDKKDLTEMIDLGLIEIFQGQ